MPWKDYFQMATVGLAIQPSEFWKLTIPEFWAMYDLKFAHVPEKITRDDLFDMMDKYPDA